MIRIITRYFISLYCFFIYTQAELRVRASSIIGRISKIFIFGLDKPIFRIILDFDTFSIRLLPSSRGKQRNSSGVEMFTCARIKATRGKGADFYRQHLSCNDYYSELKLLEEPDADCRSNQKLCNDVDTLSCISRPAKSDTLRER